ncbi:Intermediate filament protein family and Intermediate filament, ifa/ifb family-containing protein [Aphelenchoides bicaudatus]|nr:Intermediate filament protein family and Intermediate filament, ifa/ifb family-containing protein [Aphelenchoides bicaudatus]
MTWIQETLNRIDQQNQTQTLLEEVEFLRRMHDQELKDLRSVAARDTTSENREYFKNELSEAIHDIRQEYEQINNRNRTDMESWYRLKVQEIQTQSARQHMEKGYAREEVKRLRVQLSDLRVKLADLESKNNLLQHKIQQLNIQLGEDQHNYEGSLNERDNQIRKVRDECQSLMVELQMLLDTKQSLDNEISLYRKMLDGDKSKSGLKQLIEKAMRNQNLVSSSSQGPSNIESGQRVSYQRSAKGNVAIQEVSSDGHFVVLVNTHRSKDENISKWQIRRKLQNQPEIVFTFPKKYVLKSGKSVRVCAKGMGFGVGVNAQTTLVNKDGEERAQFIQRLAGN